MMEKVLSHIAALEVINVDPFYARLFNLTEELHIESEEFVNAGYESVYSIFSFGFMGLVMFLYPVLVSLLFCVNKCCLRRPSVVK